ncbi:MAG: hypothetical protein ACYC0F_16385 [Rhodanobacter sp.]
MRNIGHVTTSPLVPGHQAGRSSGRDFADELDKTDPKEPGPHPRRPVADHSRQTPADAIVPHTAEIGGPVLTMASAAQAEPMRQPDAAVQPTGITEALLGSRVFGVHLLASTYLSELYASAGQTGPATLPDAMPIEMKGMADGVHDASSGKAHVAVAATVDPSPDGLAEGFAFFARQTVEAARDEFRSSTVTRTAPGALQEAFWPEDSLRLTRQIDGSLTVWLRDYRMDEAQAAHVVHALVREAGSREMHLGKIFLNGREVWTSPNTEQELS